MKTHCRIICIVLCSIIGLMAIIAFYSPEEICCTCGTDETEVFQEEQEEQLLTGRRVRKIWFAGGGVRGIEQAEFQRRVMAGLSELSSFTNTDFVQSNSPSGAYVKIYIVSDATMLKKYTRGGIPLILQTGNQFWYRQADPRFSMPVWDRLLEVGTMHEMGHRIGLRYPENREDRIHSLIDLDVMSIQGTARELTPADKQKFQQKLGKPLSMRWVQNWELVA